MKELEFFDMEEFDLSFKFLRLYWESSVRLIQRRCEDRSF
jgi:hypothetical protein